MEWRHTTHSVIVIFMAQTVVSKYYRHNLVLSFFLLLETRVPMWCSVIHNFVFMGNHFAVSLQIKTAIIFWRQSPNRFRTLDAEICYRNIWFWWKSRNRFATLSTKNVAAIMISKPICEPVRYSWCWSLWSFVMHDNDVYILTYIHIYVYIYLYVYILTCIIQIYVHNTC